MTIDENRIDQPEDLIHRRPFLSISLGFQLLAILAGQTMLPGFYIALFETGAVASLGFYALHNHLRGAYVATAVVMFGFAMAPWLEEMFGIQQNVFYGVAAICGAAIALAFPRHNISYSQIFAIIGLLILIPLISWLWAADIGLAMMGMLAAATWRSIFPRYRAGIGSVILWVGLIGTVWSAQGFMPNSLAIIFEIARFIGLFLIATGFVQGLMRRDSHLLPPPCDKY